MHTDGVAGSVQLVTLKNEPQLSPAMTDREREQKKRSEGPDYWMKLTIPEGKPSELHSLVSIQETRIACPFP